MTKTKMREEIKEHLIRILNTKEDNLRKSDVIMTEIVDKYFHTRLEGIVRELQTRLDDWKNDFPEETAEHEAFELCLNDLQQLINEDGK